MPADPTTAAWERLGAMLEQRRVELDPRYKNLALFTGERGINYRLAWDIEAGRRTNYRRPTRRAIEVAYGLRPGEIDTVLSGGHLTPLSGRAAHQPPPVRPEDYEGYPALQRIAGDPDLSDRLKRALIGLAEDMERANGGEDRKRA
jgi:hypothetical protein